MRTSILLQIAVNIEHDKDIEIEDIVNELDYRIEDTTGKARIVTTEIENFEERDCS